MAYWRGGGTARRLKLAMAAGLEFGLLSLYCLRPGYVAGLESFLDWRFTVGCLKPDDPQGWSSIVGPMGNEGSRGGNFKGRMDRLVGVRATPNQVLGGSLPIGCFYD